MRVKRYMVEFPDDVCVITWAETPEEAIERACEEQGYPEHLALNAREMDDAEPAERWRVV
jgi:predicted RNase H-like HicB family nuclease